MEQFGYDQNDFSYVKRKGRIFIQTSNTEIQFGYLRKKYTHLNPESRQWEHGSFYKIQCNEVKEFEVGDWSEVMTQFQQWLAELPKQNP